MSWSIRLGNGQHAVRMHSARPRLGFIALGCGTGGRAWNMWPTTAKWNEMESILIRVQGLKGVGAGERPGSVWDVDPSLKGPPAVARLDLVCTA